MDSHRAPRHVLVLCFSAIAGVASIAHAQAPGAPAFEVASIKENQSASDNASVRALPGGRVSVTNNSLRNIIRNAYNVQNYRIVGGPDWINTVRWDITAKAPDDAPPQRLPTNGRPTCGTRITRGSMVTTGVGMADLARNLAPFTGDIDVTWTPEQDPSGPDGTLPQALPSSDGVSLSTAVQEQLGLKLDPRRGPVDVLVIESVERPVQD
jgi:Protein of unknown function (DUF3738)